MNELMSTVHALTLVSAALAGTLLGAMFFGGLWWTTARVAASPRPAFWFFGSLMLRMGLALIGFYLVSGGRWERMLVCLLGFWVGRLIVMNLTRPQQEVRHAPQP